MPAYLLFPLAIVAAYLLGSVPFAIISSKIFGLADPRSYGSKNPGATNVLRSGNKLAALLTLIGDSAKGAVAVLIAQYYGGTMASGQALIVVVALAVFFGHLYPLFLGFKGGKGVATAVGVLLAFQPLLALATLLTFAIIVFFTRYVSLASMVAAVFAPAYYLIGDGVAWTASGAKTLALIAMGLLLIWRHRENIQRLLAGTESKLGQKKT